MELEEQKRVLQGIEDSNNRDTLEKLVDSYGLYGILEKLSDICNEKSNHIRANWQDESLAKAWTSFDIALSVLGCKASRMLP